MKQRIRELNRILLNLKSDEERLAYLENLGEEFDELKKSDKVFFDTRDYTFYSVVKIGNHYWLGENSHYDCGKGSYTNNNEADHLQTFGRLYSYKAAKDNCPDGCVIPDFKAWSELLNICGGYLDVFRDTKIGSEPDTGKFKLIKNGGLGFDMEFPGVYEYSAFSEFGNLCYFWTSFQPTKDTSEVFTVSVENSSDYIVVNLCQAEELYSCRYILATAPKYKLKALNEKLLAIPDISIRKEFLENGDDENKEIINSENFFLDKRDYTIYSLKKFGEQIWLGENLRYNAGNECFVPNNDSNHLLDLGMLYSPDAAQTACPEGFHIPSKDEWFQLFEHLGASCSDSEIKKDTDVFLKLIDGGESGFDIKNVGQYNMNKETFTNKNAAYFLTSENTYFFLVFPDIGRDKFYSSDRNALSCRCVKNK